MDSFYHHSWGTLDIFEQSAWLHKYLLKKDVSKVNDYYVINGVKVMPLTYDDIHKMESSLAGKAKDIYIENLTSEVSVITYRNLSDSMVQNKDTTNKYYFNLTHASIETKSKCLYYASKLDYV